MKAENINTILKNTHQWKGISITPDAIKQILFLIKMHSNSKGIRISIKKSGCAGFKYTMKLVQQERKEDWIVSMNNISIHIDSKNIELIDGIKIDFIKNNINQVFKFYNKKFENVCGCGESFSIN